MKKSAFILVALLLLTLPVSAQTGFSVDCGDGTTFDNGVEVQIVEAKKDVTYRVTAVGLNGFDPILAVLDRSLAGTCNDDGENVAGYGVNLPTTGEAGASNLASQLDFQGTDELMSVVVGGYGNSSGEFVLIIEGLSLTGQEALGGVPLSVNITSSMVASGVPLTVYMASEETSLDTAVYKVDSDGNTLTDENGVEVGCDDGGGALCYGDSESLDGSTISVERGTLNANSFDSMLNLPLDGVDLSNDVSQNYFNFLLTSFSRSGSGAFVLALHAGVGELGSGNTGGGGNPPPRSQGGGSGEIASGMTVTCDTGVTFNNGVEVVVSQMRSGFTYTATAVGLNGFDPVLAVLDANGNGLCSDDDANAASYAANLPTTGSVNGSNLSSQVRFDQNSAETFADVSLVVGGFGNQTGEFLLILEGMAVTSGDQAGDPFLVQVTQEMLNSGVPLTVYMLTRGQSGVDPYIYLLDANGNPLQDDSGADVYCDDAGNPNLCYGDSVALDNSTVTINTGTLPGWTLDSMLSLPLSAFTFEADAVNYLNYLMTSFGSSEGQYLLVFHMGIGE